MAKDNIVSSFQGSSYRNRLLDVKSEGGKLIKKGENKIEVDKTAKLKTANKIRGTDSENDGALAKMDNAGSVTKNSDMVSSSKNKTLTLAEQKALASYAQYSLPKFYIPPLLVTDTNDAKDVGTGKRAGFIFTSVGNLKVEDLTFPRNLPILKVPDADIDAVQDMGFGCGNIKVSGMLWAEAGFARLQTLRELCKSRRPLIFISQETEAWYVMPQNVPGINTVANKPFQYHFDVTFVCVAQLTAKDPVIQHYLKLRRNLVRKKFNREMALIRAQNKIKNKIKNFDTLTGSGSGIQKGFYYDATTGSASYNPDLKELSNSDFKSRTSGAGGMKNDESTKTDKSSWKENELRGVDENNKKANEIIGGNKPAEDAYNVPGRIDNAAKAGTQGAGTVNNQNKGMPGNTRAGGIGRGAVVNKEAVDENSKSFIGPRQPKLSEAEKKSIIDGYNKKLTGFKNKTKSLGAKLG